MFRGSIALNNWWWWVIDGEDCYLQAPMVGHKCSARTLLCFMGQIISDEESLCNNSQGAVCMCCLQKSLDVQCLDFLRSNNDGLNANSLSSKSGLCSFWQAVHKGRS